MKRILWLTAAALCAAASVYSCSRGKAAASGRSGGVSAAFEYPAPLSFSNYGRTVTLAARPRKVLTLGPNCTETFVALGLAERVVGRSLVNHSRGPLPQYAAELRAIPELNHSAATREAVISSGADFIYGIDWEFGGDNLNIDELASYGITVYLNAASTLDEAYQEFADLGRIFGAEETAAAFIQDQKARIKAVQDKIAGLPPVRVLVYDSGNDGVFTCSGANFETLLVNYAGGKNVFDDLTEKAWITASYEAVLERSPQAIIIHDYDSPSVEAKLAEIRGNDTLTRLDAVKNERFVVIELESVLPGDRLAYTVEKLSKGLYPELFQ
ncbi:ABC transporter substrate-binding protein [Treponema endosymbiont of Eucomonympha sp.]|uniref:ABC transporter substrate-binding protein n=1 Tax=Treponema endosymbiont of Eucomonympha sp. TaxID=1580831 RepID=UPI000ACCDD04|nr:ABC transporter substrate-binding protein [Treponema endosymbiont of Eucomonympha sp.]